jgi:Glu-tRNA(Gln) amidotransferase subunit E-like FAD-binding protein
MNTDSSKTLAQKITAVLNILDVNASDVTVETIASLARLTDATVEEVEEIVRDLVDCDGDCDREIGCSACESTWSSAP